MKDVDLVCDMITVCRERLATDLQYEKPLCDLIKVCGLVSYTYNSYISNALAWYTV